MKVLVICISLFLMMVVVQAQQLHDSSLPLPRRLRLLEKASTVKVNGDVEPASFSNHHKGSASGKQVFNKDSGGVLHHGSGGTRQEWAERTDASEYFTMDYSHVKRRRPIHNKSVPVGP